MKQQLKNQKIVCFGDSITETARTRNIYYPGGSGYFNIIKSKVETFYIDYNVEMINKGIGGNKTGDLVNRLERDVLAEKPDVVTMLIGINDLWHPYDAGDVIDFDQIEKNYRYLVETIRSNNIRLVVMTPFLFPTNNHFVGLMDSFYKLLSIIRSLIKEYNLEHIDLYPILQKYAEIGGNASITKDGVHPTQLGHGIIAHELDKYFWLG